nr:hypothetical protein B0A51_13017 [Rachicladosporium sp. CCFEE 5018]
MRSRSRQWYAIVAGEVEGDALRGNEKLDDAETLRKRLLAGPTVDIFVGKERRHWTLHRKLLCHHSEWFEGQFGGGHGGDGAVSKKGSGKEGMVNGTSPDTKKKAPDKLELLDDDPRGFELLVKWLYQGSLDSLDPMTDEEKYNYAVACHKLYLLCSKFSISTLANASMDIYRMALNSAQLVPDPVEINEIYRSSPPKSPFRKLMVKIAARQIMDPDVDKDAESYRTCFESNPDFAVEMVNEIRSSSGGMLFEDPTEGVGCEWHDHEDGLDCSGKGKGKAKVTGSPGRRVKIIVEEQPVERKSPPPRTPRKLRSPGTPSSTSPPQTNGHSSAQSSPESSARADVAGQLVNGNARRRRPSTSTASIAPSEPSINGSRSTPKSVESKPGKPRNGPPLNSHLQPAANGHTGSPRQLPPGQYRKIVRQLSSTDVKTDARNGARNEEVAEIVVRKKPRKLGTPAGSGSETSPPQRGMGGTGKMEDGVKIYVLTGMCDSISTLCYLRTLAFNLE